MNHSLIIEAWKNPGRRGEVGGWPHPSGDPIESLGSGDMNAIYGGGDVQPDSFQVPTPVTQAVETLTATSVICIGIGGVGFIGGVAVTYTLRHHCF